MTFLSDVDSFSAFYEHEAIDVTSKYKRTDFFFYTAMYRKPV